MRHLLQKSLLLFSLFLFGIGSGVAQVTTSYLQGIVSDANGETLPGANIVAVHEPSGTRYGAVSNMDGRFTLPNLRAGGPYTVQISFIGFRSQSYTDINLKLGDPYSLNAVLQDDSADLSEVIISATRSSDFSSSRTGAATNVSNEQINSLPTIQRSLTDFTRLTPQANGNSFAGRDGRYNNVQIDGANFNNGFGLSDGLLPGGRSQPISLDAIEEITVNIAPFDVRQSGFTGAGVNAITRSGTNSFEGSAFGFFRNQDYNGRRVGDLELDEQDQASTQILGFRLGGPIIKNKLFFFVNAEQTRNEGTNPNAVNLWRPSQDGVAIPDQNIARTRESDLISVRNHLINQWNYDPGRYQGYANDAGDESLSLFARLDWNINDKHKLSARFSNVRGSRSSLVNGSSGPRPRSGTNRVSDQSIAFESTQYGIDDIVDSYAIELSSYFTPKLSNQFIGSYSKIQATRSSFSSRVFPTIDIGFGIETNPNTGLPDGHSNYITAGYDPFTFGNDVINNNFNFVNNLTYIEGKHEITAGAAFESQNFGNQFLRVGASYYRYRTVEDFLTTGTPNEVAPIMFAVTYPYEGADTYGGITLGTAGLYLQDKINVNQKLDLTIGLRGEMALFMNELTTNPEIDALRFRSPSGFGTKNYKSGEWPKSRLNLSPRVGFNYDVTGDGSIKLRGGTGIFFGNIPFVWFTNMPSGAGGYQNNVEPNSYGEIAGWIGNIRFNPDQYHWPNNPPAGAEDVFLQSAEGGVPSTIALVDDNFKMPSVWRSSLGLDYELPSLPITLTTDLMYTRDVNAVYQFLANRAEATQFINNGNDNREFHPTGATRFNPAIGPNNVFILSNTQEKGNIFNATFGASVNTNYGFFGSLAYTYTYADEVSSNPGSSANSAFAGPNINNPNQQMLYNSFFAVPHRVVGSISYRFNYLNHAATTISLFYEGAHQGRFSYRYLNDANNDGINSDLLYVPANNSEINFADIMSGGAVQFTAAQQLAAFNSFVDNDPHLSGRRGQYAERNANLFPWLNRMDFRLLQDVFTDLGSRRNTLQLSLDILNFGNFINSDWGIAKGLNNAQNLLNPVSIQQNGPSTYRMNTVTEGGQTVLPTTPFRNITTTSTTWSMQVGLRYIF